MRTSIYLSKKIENTFHKSIIITDEYSLNSFGKWNAQLFFINRKKWILITHSETKYSIFIPDINSKIFPRINELILNSFFNQLVYEGIDISKENLRTLIGEIVFHKTDNDRKTIGTQNSILEIIKQWKFQNSDIFNSINELTYRINKTPTNAFKWKNPTEMMIEKLQATMAKIHLG